MNYNKFQIFEFKLEKMVPDPAIVMVAKRGSGKSYITRDIIYHLRHIPGGVVIAPTDRMNSFYKYFFPDLYIHYDIKDSILKKVLLRQMLMIEKAKEKEQQGKHIDPSAILVMDDCLARKKAWAKDENILEILMNGRHYKLTYILTMQTPLGITPDLRLNFDYVFLLKEDSAINKKKNFGTIMLVCFQLYKRSKKFLPNVPKIIVLWLLITVNLPIIFRKKFFGSRPKKGNLVLAPKSSRRCTKNITIPHTCIERIFVSWRDKHSSTVGVMI